MINDQNMNGKHQCTQQHKQIPHTKGELLCHTQEIQPCHSNQHTQNDQRPNLLSHKDSQYGNQNDIHRRDKACLSHRSEQDAELLQAARHSQDHAAADTSSQKHPAIASCLLHCLFLHAASFLQTIHEKDHRYQNDAPENASDTVKGKWSHIIHPHTLGHKSTAPDQSRQKQHDVIFHLFHFLQILLT